MKKIMLIPFILMLAIYGTSFALDNQNSELVVKESANQMFNDCDRNKDGMISKEEYNNKKEEKFKKYDTNDDSFLNKSEHEMMMVEMHDKLMNT